MNNHRPYSLLVAACLLLALIPAVSCAKPRSSPTVVLPTAAVTIFPTPTPAATATGLPPQQTAAPTRSPSPLAPTAVVAANTPARPANAAALVNNQPVSLQEFEAQVALATSALSQQQNFDPQTEEGRAALVQIRHQILDAMIDQTLIEQAAAREGIVVPMEKVDAEMQRLSGDNPTQFDEWLKANEMTRDSFQAQLQHQLLSAAFQEFIVGASPAEVEQVHARHILVATEAEAMDVLIKLQAGAGFAALAGEYSEDRGTSSTGGDLGFFPRGIMPAAIETVAFALNPGQTSGIVRTDFGYHIIQVVERDPHRPVAEEMLPAWRQNMFMDWLDAERAKAKIEYLVSFQ